MSLKIGILGGTFNPVHYGHLAAAEEVKSRLMLDRVLFIPTFIPPHKQDEDLPSAGHRLEMIRLAVQGNPAFEPSDIEIKRGGRSYTINTIEDLRRAMPGAEFYFVTGIDTFLEIQTWHRWQQLLAQCAFVVLSRPGYRFIDLDRIDFMQPSRSEFEKMDSGTLLQAIVRTGAYTVFLEMIPLYDISSTDIRSRVKQGRSVKYLLPEAVETYIIKNKFYA